MSSNNNNSDNNGSNSNKNSSAPCCATSACNCGVNCRCTETLCLCQASSLLNSISFVDDANHLYQATWSINMHCQSCVRMTKTVLGDRAVVDFATKTATLPVTSEQEAKDLTEDLLDVGLDAELKSIVLLSSLLLSSKQTNEATTGSNPGKKNKKKKKKKKKGKAVTPEVPVVAALDERSALITNNHQPQHPDPLVVNEDPLASPDTSNEDEQLEEEDETPTTSNTIELVVGGMTCSMCSRAITQTLEQLPGVQDVTVSLATNVARIIFTATAAKTTATSVEQELTNAVEAIGYEVQQVLSNTMAEDNDNQAAPSSAAKMEEMEKSQQANVLKRKRGFLHSLIGTLPITIITMVLPHISVCATWMEQATISIHGQVVRKESLVLAALGTMVQFYSGWCFYRTARNNIVHGQLGMDVLVAIGTTASFVYAWYQTWNGEEAHAFETSAVLISFVLLGKWMNALAVRRTSEALTKLMHLQSKTAIRVVTTDNGSTTEETVDVALIHPGDIVKILRGASLPADGVVTFGEMTVDESMMTGESLPILKTPGSVVLGGTVCSESSGTLVQVTGVGANTALSQIVQLVQEAQTRQVPIQSLADTISSFFVPTVCFLAVLTYLVWYALCNTGVVPKEWYEAEGDATFSLMFGIACLVISCPCALGLATPTAVMVGTGVAAQCGVLMKGGETLEMASKVDSIVFDKTGTLTAGKPCITDFFMFGNDSPGKQNATGGSKRSATMLDRDDLLWIFASLERNSEHPLAEAVVSYATEQLDADYLERKPLTAPLDFQAKTGRGAMGRIGNDIVAIGNRPFVKDMAPISRQVERTMTQLEHDGKTAILASVNNEIKVVMGIADELKADAGMTLRYLQDQMGMDVWMVTGDNSRTATAIANQLGLAQNRVISEALPVAKVQQVKKLQKEGKMVCMVGDGINDSAALAQANVGVSVGTGAEIAVEAADMVLVREGQLQGVVTALDLSRVIFRRIQLNLVLSMIYNCLGIPVAMGVFYPLVQVRLPPTLAAVAMALSSLSVVSSSLALKLYKPPKIDVQPGIIRQLFRRMNSSSNGNNNNNRQRTMSSSTVPASNRRRSSSRAVNEESLREPLLTNAESLDEAQRMEEGLETTSS